jgi:hypothetical protein
MKTFKQLITPCLLLLTIIASGQMPKDNYLKMSLSFPDLDTHRLLDFQDIDYYKVNITGNDLKGKQYYVVSKEFIKGKLTVTDTLFDTTKSPYVKPVQHDTLSFFIISQESKEKDIKIQFGFDGFNSIKKFKNQSSLDYKLMDVAHQFPIEIGKPFYAFAYILPYVQGDIQYYCAPAKSGKDIETWGEEFDIEHYYLLEMCFFNNKPLLKK